MPYRQKNNNAAADTVNKAVCNINRFAFDMRVAVFEQEITCKMIAEVHKIMKKSGGEKCLALLKKRQKEQQLFESNGYLFMKAEVGTIGYLEEVHGKIVPARVAQGVYYISR